MSAGRPTLAVVSALVWALACGGGTSEGGSGPGTGSTGGATEGGAAAGGRGGSMPRDAGDASDDTGGGFGGLGGSAGHSSADASCVPQRYLLSLATPADAAAGCEYVWPDELVGVSVGWCSEISVRLREGDAGTHLSYVGSDSALCSDAGGWYLVDQRLVFCAATCDAHSGASVEVTRMCAIPPC